MSVKLRILSPEATTNYVLNPQMRYSLDGWSAAGSSTITRSLDYARFGIASAKVVTSGSVLNEGIYYRVSSLQGVSDSIAGSVYIRGAGKVRIRVVDGFTGEQFYSQPFSLLDRWQRLSTLGRISGTAGGNDVRLYVETADITAKVITFYVDGAQVERKPYATTYCDGDVEGCRWNGLAHASSSSRAAFERSGGRWVTLASPELEDTDLYMTVLSGFGSPPINNITNSFSLLPGSYHQGFKVEDRVMILNFHTKHKDFGCADDNTLTRLHALRQALFDVIKPDKNPNSEFIIEYTDGAYPIYIKARYDGGFEGQWDIRNRWVNSFPIRLLSVSPLLWEDDQEVYSMDYQDTLILNNVGARVDGAWSRLNYGFDGDVNDFELGSRGEIIAAGSFTTANNNASALSPLLTVNRIAYWDGEKWVAFGSGANGTINDIAVAPNGYVYVTGNFTSIGGVAANYVAYWNGTTWNALGTGLNAQGYNITVAPNGHIFVGGTFTTAGGTNAYYIARWNGTAWSALGSASGLNGYVHSIAISADGSLLYAGGAFTDEFGNPGSSLTRVAVYNIVAGTWDNMGNGFASTVQEVIIAPSGAIFVGGEFTLSGSETINYIAEWNGSAWTSLGSGMNGTVYSMAVSPNGDLVAVGSFTQAGSATVKKIALWNGSTWVNLDIDIGQGNTGTTLYAVNFTRHGDLYVGGTQFSGGTYPSLFSGITSVDNVGTAQTSPRLYLRGSGTLRWLENQTSEKRVFLNLVLLDDEDVFIDFGTTSVQSSIRGNLSFSVLQGSDFRQFTLLPGVNKIAAFMEDDIDALMKLSYTPTHWSVDATATREEL